MDLSTSAVQTDPNVVCTQLQNGDSVLLHLNTQTYYSLNPTGVFIWEQMDGEKSVSEIGDALEQTYDVSLQQAHECVQALVQELAEEKLVMLVNIEEVV